MDGVQKENVKGDRLLNGNFIFSWIDGSLRKMALTTNNGTQIKASYVFKNVKTWKDPSTWQFPGHYTISNFNGTKIGRFFSIHDIRYAGRTTVEYICGQKSR